MQLYSKLATFGSELLKHPSIDDGIPLISSYVKEVTGAQRCSIYIYNQKAKTLWTALSDGVGKIRLSDEEGIAGQTVKEAKPIIENTPYNNPNFNIKIDQHSGYVTENIASIPIFNSARSVIGIMQLLNKPGGFSDADTRFMVFFAHYVSGYIELSVFFNDDAEALLRRNDS